MTRAMFLLLHQLPQKLLASKKVKIDNLLVKQFSYLACSKSIKSEDFFEV